MTPTPSMIEEARRIAYSIQPRPRALTQEDWMAQQIAAALSSTRQAALEEGAGCQDCYDRGRKEALEEAAKVAEQAWNNQSFECNQRDHAQNIASAIRQLKGAE